MRASLLLLALVAGFLPSAAAQSNDSFAGRLALSGDTATAVSNNLSATRENGEPNHAAGAAGRSLWWTWTPSTSGMANFSTFNGSSGSTPPRVLAVYAGGNLSALTEVGSSNNLPSYSTDSTQTSLYATGASVNASVVAGTTYQIAVDAAANSLIASDDGTVVLSINAPPTIVSAASVNASASTSFQYKILASNGPTSFDATNLPLGLSLNPVSGLISGLPAANGTYAVGISATGPGGTGTATLTIQVADPTPVAAAAPVVTGAAGVNGVVGKTLTYYFYATGSPTGYTAGPLPAGLTLNATSGTITGTPTAAGTFIVPLSATNSVGTGNATLTINVIDIPLPPVISSSLAAVGTVGSSFTYAITTSGDNTATAPASYAAASLPPGLSLGTSNSISGTPTQAGSYPVSISATNAGGTSTATVTITVSAATTGTAPVTAPSQLSSSAAVFAAVNTTFSYTLAGTNTPTRFSASNLPPGLSADVSTGLINGTPTAAGTYLVPVSAGNAYGTSTGTLTITVVANTAALAALSPVVQPAITSAAAVGGNVGQTLTYTLAATYNGSSYLSPSGNWTFTASGLPPGVSLSSASSPYGTTNIRGTPTQSGTYVATVTAAVPASSPYRSAATTTATVTFLIKTGPAGVPTFGLPASLSANALTSTFDQSSNATNSPASYASSGLPPGVTLNPSSGYLSGTPTAAGTYKATFSATNSVGTGTATVTFYISPTPPSRITSLAAAYGTVGNAFSYTLTGQFYFSSCTAVNLPPGLTCNQSTCVISGTPTVAGTYTVPVTGTNTSYGSASGTLTITIVPLSRPVPVITSKLEALGTVGSGFSYAISATYAATGYAAGSLPPGLAFNAASGVISGTPTAAGTYNVALSATNASGMGTASLLIAVAPLPVPVLNGNGVINMTVGTSLSYGISATGTPVSYAATGLPAGVTLNPSTGVLSGSVVTAGSYSVKLSATNASGTGGATLTINVTTSSTPAVPAFSSVTPLTYACTIYTSTSISLYTTNSPTSYAASGLPAGCSIDAQYGSLLINSGLTAAGIYPVSISATNAAGTGRAVVTLVITDPGQVPPDFTSMQASAVCYAGYLVTSFYVSLGIGANGNPTSYAASGLPPGLTIVPSSGAIEGTTNTPGRYSVVISATNGYGTTSATWTLLVADPAILQPQFTYPSVSLVQPVGTSLYSTISVLTSLLIGGSTAYVPLTFSFSGLPPGVVAGTSGTGAYLTGTPTTVGTYPATITVTTLAGVSASQVVTIVVPDGPSYISSAASIGGNTGNPLSYTLASSDTISGCTASGLPPGLTLNTSTRTIAGTPTSAGTFAASVSITTPAGTTSGTVTFLIAGPAFDGLPVINSPATALCQDIVSTTYPSTYGMSPATLNYTITAINAPASFGATNLPVGVNLNPTTGAITGQPLTSGIFPVTISATNSVGSFSATLTIIGTVTYPRILSALASQGSVGTAYQNAIQTTVTSYYGLSYYEVYIKLADPLTFAAAGLPPGLSVNTATGYITGTPTQVGSYPVTVFAANRGGTTSAILTLVIAATAPAPTTPPVFSGAAMVAGFRGLPLSYKLTATGTHAYTAAGLPDGLSLDAVTGQITGTPTTLGTFPVAISAANDLGITRATLTITIGVVPTAPYVGSAAQASATVGSPFNYYLYAYNYAGTPAVTAYAVGNLPTGLTFNARSSVITGTPTGPAGTYQIPLSATVGTVTGNATLTLTVQDAATPAGPPLMAAPAGALGFLKNPFTFVLSKGFSPASTLPAGLSFDPVTGAIIGYPSTAGTYAIPLGADSSGTMATALTLRGSRKSPIMSGSGTGSAMLTLSVAVPTLSLPRLVSQPTGGTIMQNESGALAVTAMGIPEPTYQWTHNGVPVTGGTTATLPLTQVQPADSGAYSVTVANAAGQVRSISVTLLVLQTYGTWQTAHFTASEITAGVAAEQADFSGDGVPNLLKYGLGIDPRTSAGGALPVGTYVAADGALQLAYTRDAGRTDLNFVVEASTDLGQWTSIASSVAGAATTNLGAAFSIVESAVPGTSQVNVLVEGARTQGTGNRQFMRLRIVRP